MSDMTGHFTIKMNFDGMVLFCKSGLTDAINKACNETEMEMKFVAYEGSPDEQLAARIRDATQELNIALTDAKRKGLGFKLGIPADPSIDSHGPTYDPEQSWINYLTVEVTRSL